MKKIRMDPAEKPYSFKGKKVSLKDMLTAEKWDYVTIQQFSMFSFKIDTYRPFAKNLVEYIRKYAPSAEVVFHQTWAYRADDDRLFKDGFDQKTMYQQLTKNYHTIADEIGIRRIIPVGDAFQLAAESPEWKFESDKNFDFAKAESPNLPDQTHSLHVGYRWKKTDGKDTLSYDSHHANFAGEFLAGCVWFEFFFGDDVRNNTFKPDNMENNDAEILRSIAHKVVTEGVKPAAWPMGETDQRDTERESR